jgi:D-alanine-D-alanine ligase-like ATP-grasp enzyme
MQDNLSQLPEVKPHYPSTTKLLISLFLSNELPNVQHILIEPEYGHAGRILYKDTSVRMFRSTRIGLNNNSASEIAKDKGYTKYFLRMLGYNTPKGQVFLISSYIKFIDKKLSRYDFKNYAGTDRIYTYISSEIGYPCFIKPNSESQGRGINRCFDETDVELVIDQYRREGITIFLAEEAITFPDYRVVVFRNEVIACYLRKPLYIVGDGVSTIRELLLEKQGEFVKIGRDTTIDVDDSRIEKKLARSAYTLDSVLNMYEECQIHDVSNLSVGGDAEDYIDKIHQHWRDLCVRVTADMGLSFCGVDIACANLEDPEAEYSIIELNASPGLDNYAASGEKQALIVRSLYKKVYNESL